MRLQVCNRILSKKLFQVFAKMAVIVITILPVIKAGWGVNQLLNRFSYPQDLQRFFTAEAGGCFKITVQRTS